MGFQLPAAYSVTESDESVNITIVKQGSTTATITVNFTTVSGAATGRIALVLGFGWCISWRMLSFLSSGSPTAPGDFVETQTQIAIQPGESEKSIVVQLVNDITVESTESFIGMLTLLTNQPRVRLGEDSVSITVIDDDSKLAPIFSLLFSYIIIL